MYTEIMLITEEPEKKSHPFFYTGWLFCCLQSILLWKRNAYLKKIIYAFSLIFSNLLKCPNSPILQAIRAFCFCGKPRITRSDFLYFSYQTWLKSW